MKFWNGLWQDQRIIGEKSRRDLELGARCCNKWDLELIPFTNGVRCFELQKVKLYRVKWQYRKRDIWSFCQAKMWTFFPPLPVSSELPFSSEEVTLSVVFLASFAANTWVFDLSSAQKILHLEASDAKKQGLRRWGPWAVATQQEYDQRQCWQQWCPESQDSRGDNPEQLMVSGSTRWDDSDEGIGVQSWLFPIFPAIFKA